MPSLCRVLALALSCSWSAAQDPVALAVADALAHGDGAAAAASVAGERDLARRALLQAALVPLANRPAAMLSVAQRFVGHAVAGQALMAGFAAAAVLQGRADLVAPDLQGLCEQLGDEVPMRQHDPRIDVHLAVVIPQLLALHRRWEGEHADDPRVQELRQLARLSACQRVTTEPLPIEPDTAWPVPRGLVDDLLVSVRPLGDAVPNLQDAVAALDREPTSRWLLAAKDAPQSLRCPPPGRWLLEVQSLQTPWRSVRVVDVTSLATILLVDDGVIAFHAHAAGGFADGAEPTWSLWHDRQRDAASARGAVGVWQLGREHAGAWVVQARSGDERARARVYVPRAQATLRQQHVVHWQFDRPLHRPGEVLRGRVVVRQVGWSGEGLSAVPTTKAGASLRLQLRGRWPATDAFAVDLATDERGVASFELPIPAVALPGEVLLQLCDHDGLRLDEQRGTTIASFRRPAMAAAVEGPRQVGPNDELATVTLRVQWASGGAAAAVPVDVEVRGSDRQVETRRLATGADGRLSLPIEVAGRPPGSITCDLAVHGVDGQTERLCHVVGIGEPEAGTPRADAFRVDVPTEVVVGENVAITVHAPPYSRALGVVGRGGLARAEALWIGSTGRTVWNVEVTAADWPRLEVAVTRGGAWEVARGVADTRQRPAVPLQLAVPAAARPHERVVCGVRAAKHCVVTLAVVDDRIFRLVADPTRTADASLRPWVESPYWRAYRSDEPADARRILGELLVDGRVPGPGERPRYSPGAGGSAGPSGPSAGATATRADFRATACFVTVITDAEGMAEVPIDLPDDVTTWRVTATSVDERGEGSLAVARVEARLPLAAEPVLPRVLRRGDRMQVPLVLDRARASDDVGLVAYAVEADGALQVADAMGERRVGAGAAVVVPFDLAGAAVGAGTLRFRAADGVASDRSERTLAVLEDTVRRQLVATGAGRGTVEVAAPAERDPDAPLQLVVLAGGAAAWQQLARRLDDYPYGCVEQTLSRLLPFAAAGLAEQQGDTGRRDGRSERLGKGMARLRQLQVARGGAFAWWPGQAADLGMTGLVLHGLAVLRAGGVDPAAYGIGLDVELLRAQWQPATSPDANASLDAVELLAGMLRLLPGHAELRTSAAKVVDAQRALPRGACLRLGLALAAAGDAERARRCLLAPSLGAVGRGWFPGEDPLVAVAQEIELRRALGEPIEAAAEVRLVRELLAAGCRTYTDGAALVALAPSLQAPPGGVVVEVAVDDGAPTSHAIQPGAGPTWQGTLPAGRRCVVRCRDTEQLLFVQVAAARTRAAVGEGWAAPFVVQRTLLALDPAGRWQKLVGDIAVGERLRVRTTITSPVSTRYVALVCPLPAGFEVVGEDEHLQRFDDRVVGTLPRLAAATAEVLEFDVVATLPGRVLWPPASAEAMYELGVEGGSDGVVLTVAPGAVGGHAQPAVWLRALPRARTILAESPPTRPATPSERAAAAAGEIDAVWQAGVYAGMYGFDDEPDEDGRQRVDAALSTLRELLAVADEVVAGELAGLALVAPGEQPGGTLSSWRLATLARLDELRESSLQLGLARAERRLGEGDPVGSLATLLQRLPPSQREAAVLRLLSLTWPDSSSASQDVLTALQSPVRDEALATFLVTMLATAADDVLDLVLRLLPESSWSSLPTTALADLAARGGEASAAAKVVAQLARTPAGVHELVQRAGESTFAASLAVQHWPDAVLVQLPWPVLARLAAEEPSRAATVLAAGTTPTVELWRLVLARGDSLPLAVVVDALRRRGPIALPDGVVVARIADPTVRTLVLALLAAGDPTRLPAVLTEARELQHVDRDDAVEQAVGDLLGEHGSAAQVVEFAGWLAPVAWARLWARLDPAGAGRVLAETTSRMSYGLPTTDDVLITMLGRADEWRDVDDAVAAILATATGEARLRAVLPRLPEALAGTVRTEMARWLGLDAATLLPLSDPADCVVPLASVRGWACPWPAHLLPARDRLLRLRGLW